MMNDEQKDNRLKANFEQVMNGVFSMLEVIPDSPEILAAYRDFTYSMQQFAQAMCNYHANKVKKDR